MNREVRDFIKKLADKHGLRIEQVIDMYEAPFKLQVHNMKTKCDRKELKFPSLRIPYLGIFYCPEWHKRRLKKKNDETNN